jgi:hypothetical protein
MAYARRVGNFGNCCQKLNDFDEKPKIKILSSGTTLSNPGSAPNPEKVVNNFPHGPLISNTLFIACFPTIMTDSWRQSSDMQPAGPHYNQKC